HFDCRTPLPLRWIVQHLKFYGTSRKKRPRRRARGTVHDETAPHRTFVRQRRHPRLPLKKNIRPRSVMRDESSYNAFITGPAADSQKTKKFRRRGVSASGKRIQGDGLRRLSHSPGTVDGCRGWSASSTGRR